MNTEMELRNLKLQVNKLDNLVKYLMANNKDSVMNTIGQITNVIDTGTSVGFSFTVELYANGTISTQNLADNSVMLTVGTATNTVTAYQEVYTNDALEVGEWVKCYKKGNLWYINNFDYTTTPISSSLGVSSDFFCDFFDREDSGELNGYWGGIVGSYTVSNGTCVSIKEASKVSSTISVAQKNYIIKIGLTWDNLAQNNSIYMNTSEFDFGKDGIFRIIVQTWVGIAPSGDVNIVPSYSIEKQNYSTNATNSTKSTSYSTNVASYADSAAAYAKNAVYYNSNDAAFYADNASIYAANANNAAYYAANSTMYAASYGEYGAYPADNAVYYAANAANFEKFKYVDITDNKSTNQYLNLGANIIGNLILVKNGVAVKCLGGFSMPIDTHSGELALQVNGNTVMVNFNGHSFSYSDASLIRNCGTLGIAHMVTADHVYSSYIKAYRSDMPEPTESGYGKYDATASVQIQYKDKYHTPIKNADGNLTGYNYNPNA